MRICLVSRYFDTRNAGVGRVGLEIRNELVKRGHTVYSIHTNGKSLYSYFFYTGFQIPLKLLKADVYHAITPMEAMWLPKEKSVVTFHDLFQITDPDKLGSGIGYSRWKNLVGTRYYALAAHIATRCKGIVAVSEKTKQELITYLHVPEERITMITSGIRPDLHPMHERRRVRVVGYLGQLDRRKRVDLLIKAFRRSSDESIKLQIGGTGSDEAMLRSLAQGDSRIEFLGRIPDNDLVFFYNSLDVLIFPTWLEGYGLPIVEAMACKRPVIVLGDAKIPNEVKNRCIIVKELDILFETPTYLENRCTYNDYDSNYQWAKSHDWKKTVDAYETLYKELV